MKKSRFSETQIVAIRKEADVGMKVADVCCKHGISQPTYYNWKSKYGGMSASELKRIKELEAEHSKLKRMYADLAMENDALKELIGKINNQAQGPKLYFRNVLLTGKLTVGIMLSTLPQFSLA